MDGQENYSPTRLKSAIPRPTSAALGNTTKSASPSSEERKSARYDLQHHAQRLTPAHRVRVCHKAIAHGKDGVEIRRTAESARFNGLMSCGNVWACPVCMSRINAQRAEALRNGLTNASFLGYRAYLLTLTVRHDRTDHLADLIDALTKAYRYMWSGKTGQAIKRALTWQGSARALEIRHAMTHGWHPHFHIIVLTENELDADTLSALTTRIKARWMQSLSHVGYDATFENGADLRTSTTQIFNYLTKADRLADELTATDTKKSAESRSPIELLNASREGEQYASALWREYVTATKGAKALVMCPSFRELTEYDQHLANAESAEQTETESAELVAVIPPALWHMIKQHRDDLRAEILHYALHTSTHNLAEFLSTRLQIPLSETMKISIYHPLNPRYCYPSREDFQVSETAQARIENPTLTDVTDIRF